MKAPAIAICLILEMIGAVSAAEPQVTHAPVTPGNVKDIKAYCLDFTWAATGRKRKPFAAPGTWAGADPAEHVAWYKAMGANVIQTFCASNNGYACMYKEADWLIRPAIYRRSAAVPFSRACSKRALFRPPPQVRSAHWRTIPSPLAP
ncbi:MAG: hypothetical protein NTW21_03855 [Verrucomicrobia bacterium]|nr:hypothetical protein [Verrucomicrobiota bacterium]